MYAISNPLSLGNGDQEWDDNALRAPLRKPPCRTCKTAAGQHWITGIPSKSPDLIILHRQQWKIISKSGGVFGPLGPLVTLPFLYYFWQGNVLWPALHLVFLLKSKNHIFLHPYTYNAQPDVSQWDKWFIWPRYAFDMMIAILSNKSKNCTWLHPPYYHGLSQVWPRLVITGLFIW